MERNKSYNWIIETLDGEKLEQYNSDGSENSWKGLNKKRIHKVSFIPNSPFLKQHELIIDTFNGNYFQRRFGRGFLKQSNQFKLSEYLNCIVTKHFRFYLTSDGQVIITPNNYEIKV
ncbi:MAG: hypothetical protein GQ540_03600 [Lutibacter sp.]|uniref:hypothetical protein n=1 Tax=Lutibacter sp. TaxID=1925666 RepID=UPI0019F8684C|nr:hypothetical protein [Lutibacter sp.]NOR27597.1 hypothetical protein [Lutibacter sp.]